MENKPNTIAVFKDGEIWERFNLYMTSEEFTIGLSKTLGKFLADDNAKELSFRKYYDDRVKS